VAVRRDWALVAASLGAAALLLTAGRCLPPEGRAPDDRTSIEVTVVPADARALACAGRAGGASCAFNPDGTATGEARPLRPFVTTGGRLVLLRGLFEQEAVRAWLASPKAPDERVRVRCEARRLAADVEFGARFAPGGAFAPGRGDAADVSDCALP
jgi:hypothetical protein